MKITQVFTYNEGPWYDPKEALRIMGIKNKMIEQMVIKISEYEKRRLFALKDIKDKQMEDNEFLGLLKNAFDTMVTSLVNQYLSCTANNSKKIQSITIINNQGIPKPGYDESIKKLLNIGSVPIYHITGMNCVSVFLALQHLHRLRVKNPLGEDECDLLFSVEVPSTTILRNRKILPLCYIFYDVVISDGAGLVVLESEKNAHGLKIMGHRNFLFPKIQDTLTSRTVGNQVEQGISSELFQDIERVIKPSVKTALKDVNLSAEQIKHWICHPGGVRIVNCVCRALGLEDKVMDHARNTVRSQGNAMSSLVIYVLKKYFESNEIKHEDLGILIGFGPGFEIQTLTARYL